MTSGRALLLILSCVSLAAAGVWSAAAYKGAIPLGQGASIAVAVVLVVLGLGLIAALLLRLKPRAPAPQPFERRPKIYTPLDTLRVLPPVVHAPPPAPARVPPGMIPSITAPGAAASSAAPRSATPLPATSAPSRHVAALSGEVISGMLDPFEVVDTDNLKQPVARKTGEVRALAPEIVDDLFLGGPTRQISPEAVRTLRRASSQDILAPPDPSEASQADAESITGLLSIDEEVDYLKKAFD